MQTYLGHRRGYSGGNTPDRRSMSVQLKLEGKDTKLNSILQKVLENMPKNSPSIATPITLTRRAIPAIPILRTIFARSNSSALRSAPSAMTSLVRENESKSKSTTPNKQLRK